MSWSPGTTATSAPSCAPFLKTRRPRGRGPRHRPVLTTVAFGDDAELRAFPTVARDLRDVEPRDLEGFDAVVHLAGLSNDPLGDIDAAADLRHQRRRARCAWRAPPRKPACGRFLFSSSCSTYGAGGRRLPRRERRVPAGDAVRRVQGALRAGAARDWPDDASRRPPCATPPPTACRRGCAWTWCSTTWSPGRTPPAGCGSCRTVRRGARSSTSKTSRAPSWRCSRRRAKRFTTAPSTSVAPIRTTGSASWPRSSPRRCRARWSKWRRVPSPDKRNYRVSCDLIRRELPAFVPAWDARRGARELVEAYRAIGLTREAFDGPRYKRLAAHPEAPRRSQARRRPALGGLTRR